MAGLAEVETALPDLGPVGLQLLVGEQAAHHVLPQVHVREDLVRVPQDLLPFGQRHRGSLVRVPGFWVIFRHAGWHCSSLSPSQPCVEGKGNVWQIFLPLFWRIFRSRILPVCSTHGSDIVYYCTSR